ncbi:unnamed protein product [Moneuplotes crassus]|uniref:Uncharacterized protein n=1 Tax=Euplotes crassus TaxID=5936 RepID=A0AAD1XXD1_EUPCR|nr:unnamed protein product [Moneuplotes crassus]
MNIGKRRINWEKWTIFCIFISLIVIQVVNVALEQVMTHDMYLGILSVVRVMLIGLNRLTLIPVSKKLMHFNTILTVMAYIYCQYLTWNAVQPSGMKVVYSILSGIQIFTVFILAKWYINCERTESWKYFRTGTKAQEYIPLDQFQYGNLSKGRISEGPSQGVTYQHTAELKEGKIVVRVKPISEIIQNDVECNEKDELVSSVDKIDQYDRRSGHSIFLS